MQRIRFGLILLLTVSLAGLARGEDSAAVEKRLSESVKYLASDELEGRGIGSQGLDQAAEHIASQFRKIGLKTQLFDGTPFQKFEMVTGAKLGKVNEVKLLGPAGDGKKGERVLKLADDYTPMALGGSGVLDLPLVFVGYGITAKKENYDDYAGIDVKDKCVIVLRHEPQQDNPHSVFDGTKTSPHAPFMRKLSNAYEHGAAAVIFLTDDFDIRKNVAERQKRWQEALDKLTEAAQKFKQLEKPTREQLEEQRKQIDDLAAQVRSQGDKLAAEYDPLLKFDTAGLESSGRDFPVLFLRRATLDSMVSSTTGRTLAELEKAIDNGPTPQSRELEGWRIKGEVSVDRTKAGVKNVVAVLEGEGPLAEETIVLGAHYDHVGRGGPGSGAIDASSKEIHNGADDNASGTAALIEVARHLAEAERGPRRRLVFIAFTGEERGLIGSDYYVKNPLFKLDDTVAMLNMDMVGRLVDDKLIIEGVKTAAEFEPLVDRVNGRYDFKLTKKPGGFGPSDHASFYAKKVPAMHFFTGTHKDYHRPSDDSDKINVSGMRRVGEMVAEVALHLSQTSERPKYQETASTERGAGGGGDRPYFGSIPDFAQDQPGYALSGVAKDSPAEKGGLKAGDAIVKLGESRIGNLEDFDSALRKYKGGDKVPVTVKRDGKEQTFEITWERREGKHMALDAYYEWLGIPPAEQPPNHYRLLGIAPFEANLNVIENAADRQMSHVRTFQTGPHSVRSQELLSQLARARVTLLNREKKAAYDAQLKVTTPAAKPATPVPMAQPPRAAAAAPKRAENLANNNLLLMSVTGAVAVVLVLGIVITVVRGRIATEPPQVAQGAENSPERVASAPAPPAASATTVREPPTSVAAAPPAKPVKPDEPPASVTAVEAPFVEDPRRPPPDEAAEAAAMKLIDDLFKLQQSRSAAEKLQLAARLLATAKETNGDPAGRYVLLGLARDYAAETGEVPIVLQAIAILEKEYRIDGQEMREASLSECVAGNMVREKRLETAYTITSAAQDAAQREQFAHAGRLFGLAGEAARRAGDHQLAGKVLAPRVQQMERALHIQKEQTGALQTLQSSPEDATANLLVGKYHCHVRGDWQQGLPYLARCGEAEIRAAAQADLAGAANAEAQARIGDLWWDLGDQAGEEKTYWQARVKYWYELAEAGLSGLSRSKVDQRLKEIDPWHGFDMSEALIIGDFARLMPGKKIVTRTPRGGPLEIRLVARTDSTNIRVNGYGGSLVIWNWEVRPNELRVHHPQKTGFIGSAKVTPLEPDTWYRLRIQVGTKEVRVFTDDRLVYQRAGNNQLVVKPVSVSNAVGSVVDVKELSVEPWQANAK